MKNLTVAICAYNCEQYIIETLICITKQTFQDFDLLIINDCSTDNTKKIIENYFISNLRQYKLIDFDDNRGLASGRHFVENHVKSKYILFVDADDCPYPKLVEKLYTKISGDKDLMAVGCHHEFIDSESKKIGGGIFLGAKTKEEFFVKAKNQKLIFMQPTAIIDREALIKVGGRNISGFFGGKPRYQDFCEDLDLWTRMSDLFVENKAIVVVPEVLCRYRKHEHGLSSNSLGMILRIRHIKTNLLRRRAGKLELTFVNFYNSLSKLEMVQLERNANVADNLKNGVFLFKKGKLFRGARQIFKSVVADPGYLFQKVKANSGIFK